MHILQLFDVINVNATTSLSLRCKCMDRAAYHNNSQHRSNKSKNRSMFSRQPASTRWTYVQCTIILRIRNTIKGSNAHAGVTRK